MELPKECMEVFLEDITDVFVYKKTNCTIPMPATIPAVTEISNCILGTPDLHIAYSASDEQVLHYAMAEEQSIIAKTSISQQGGLTLYNIEISATIDLGSEETQSAYIATDGEDCLIVVKRNGGTMQLCHTLPGTFRMDIPTSGAHPVMSFRVSAKAYSPFIDITLKEK